LRVCFISFSCLNSRGGLFQSLRFPAQAAADARAGDVVLLNHPADTTGPRCIDCYLVEVQDFAAAARCGSKSSFFPSPPGASAVLAAMAAHRHATRLPTAARGAIRSNGSTW
jgi:hypothetical protein